MNKITAFKPTFFLMILSCLILILAHLSNAQLDMEGVIAMWLLDEGKGNEVADTSGNDNDGKLVAGKAKWVDGKYGQALEFNQKGWVEMNAPAVVDTVDWTMGCWAKPKDSQKTWTNILSSHNNFRGISFEQFDNNLNRIGVAMGNGETWGGADFLQLKTGAWNHLVFTRKKRTGTWYLNGKVDNAKQMDSEKPVVASPSNFRIGNWVLGGREWNGIVDEAFIFERALGQEEIRTIMRRGLERVQPVDPKDKVATSWGKVKSRYQ